MPNKLIPDFENFLKSGDGYNIREEFSVIGIAHLFDNDDITLLLTDKQGCIGGHFTVFPLEPQRYDIGEFAEFIDWCFLEGWTVRLELSMFHQNKENALSNSLINDFKDFLSERGNGDIQKGRQGIFVIGISRIWEIDEITLLLKNVDDGIGSHFVVFPTRSPRSDEEYESSLISKPPQEVLNPPQYNVGEFVGLLDWFFRQGWIVQLELSDFWYSRANAFKNRFNIESK